MSQLRLFGDVHRKKLINVASVPQRSPFRYPGGKTWLIPYIRRWFQSFSVKPVLLVEPFAGGGIVSLTAAFEDLAEKVLMVELDKQVANVWRVILSDDASWLADRILGFRLTNETLAKELGNSDASLGEVAFRTLLRNRTNRGGILAPGTGSIKYGENGKGIASRWYPKTLSNRIRAIERIKDRIALIEADGLTVMQEYAERRGVVFFIDPPYTAGGKKAGRRLYIHNELNHAALFSLASTLAGDFLMTYDNAQEVQSMAALHHFDCEDIPMNNTHHAEMTELLIGRDLQWART